MTTKAGVLVFVEVFGDGVGAAFFAGIVKAGADGVAGGQVLGSVDGVLRGAAYLTFSAEWLGTSADPANSPTTVAAAAWMAEVSRRRPAAIGNRRPGARRHLKETNDLRMGKS